ncbi:hypothetical protein EGR_06430 [Echinococcus granulosus]|uniref:Uncharacterized protein n=1 Tax=Echinococcus granulosus TaxID=6210 RepID=W6UYW1_ECHGR|nr:hypothetical protein EGR_06430 [Echinococcus granulosus]EUB58759.1 hypothetical protein EGR_06430 [Echinococcus granulosus]
MLVAFERNVVARNEGCEIPSSCSCGIRRRACYWEAVGRSGKRTTKQALTCDVAIRAPAFPLIKCQLRHEECISSYLPFCLQAMQCSVMRKQANSFISACSYFCYAT